MRQIERGAGSHQVVVRSVRFERPDACRVRAVDQQRKIIATAIKTEDICV
jgi:hypothetical protein